MFEFIDDKSISLEDYNNELPCVLLGLKKSPSGSSEQEPSGSKDQESLGNGKFLLTPLELEGLWNLLGKLETLPSNKKCIPAGIQNASALVTHIKVPTYSEDGLTNRHPILHFTVVAAFLQMLLNEHASDDPNLSYTGKPIITWPKRVSYPLCALSDGYV